MLLVTISFNVYSDSEIFLVTLEIQLDNLPKNIRNVVFDPKKLHGMTAAQPHHG